MFKLANNYSNQLAVIFAQKWKGEFERPVYTIELTGGHEGLSSWSGWITLILKPMVCIGIKIPKIWMVYESISDPENHEDASPLSCVSQASSQMTKWESGLIRQPSASVWASGYYPFPHTNYEILCSISLGDYNVLN